ncbi:MAG: Gfo/Idh/MocA family oxidoreductase [Okeania sp. SIO3I5]|uniref:Gfo/Idh/MocA family oxidoreductase n=1 Tax=Okeania sp. SIO3I5 TaxID=2607805 RepID=UPI0013BBCB9D|nr:Gfo/Idh/MocA family oxidoreductase [Okeania sp. SIO3I5]NEQ41161.1 Gfo/Idh/MocA family oxidoreductase [Okeania sp. SIO3I5]
MQLLTKTHQFSHFLDRKLDLFGCVRVGNGNVASWHEKKLNDIGIQTLGIIEANLVKQQEALNRGINVFSSFAKAAEIRPLFWDICSPTDTHVEVIRNIIEIDNEANIIVEKPICNYEEIQILCELLQEFQGKLVVNENYIASSVTQKIKELIISLKITPHKVVSEMTKNRINDFINGRFIDDKLYAFGYEGSHIVANVMALGKEYFPQKIGKIFYQDIDLNINDKNYFLPKQGMTEKHYTAVNGAEVILYTSMAGKIKYFYPGYSPKYFDRTPEEENIRYRVLAVEDHQKGITVAGFYEPILGKNRGEGRVVICQDGIVQKIISSIADDTMGRAMKNAVEYFQGKINNPCSATTAIQIVEFMNLWN